METLCKHCGVPAKKKFGRRMAARSRVIAAALCLACAGAAWGCGAGDHRRGAGVPPRLLRHGAQEVARGQCVDRAPQRLLRVIPTQLRLRGGGAPSGGYSTMTVPHWDEVIVGKARARPARAWARSGRCARARGARPAACCSAGRAGEYVCVDRR